MSWALTAVAVSVAGVGVSVYGQVQQAQTAKAMGEYNAKLAEQQALQTEMDARENLRRKRQENKALLSRQRALYAKAGVEEAGTPLEIMADTAGDLELANLDYTRQQGVQAGALRGQAGADRALGANQARAAYIGAGATLLQGAGNTAFMGYQMRQNVSRPAGGGGGGGNLFTPAAPISGNTASLNLKG